MDKSILLLGRKFERVRHQNRMPNKNHYDKGCDFLKSPIAEKFKSGELQKPLQKKEEFFKGGYFGMKERMKIALKPFPNAYSEFISRADNLTISESSIIMFEYIAIEQTEEDLLKMSGKSKPPYL